MFSADISQVQFWEDSRDAGSHQKSEVDYLFPKFQHPTPWLHRTTSGRASLMEDFIMIAEFSEQEGPRPVIVIPKDGGADFDQNEFSVKILAVDHQSSIVEGSNTTEDAQVVMDDTEKNAHAFIHHIVLNDIQARGYVRPFCITYVTADPQKIMKCYETISTQMKKVARLMKYGNRLVFMRDLEKYLEDLDYTKAHLLISQRSQSSSSSSNDNEVLTALNTIRQSMEEVKDIMSKIRNMLNDHELEEKFQAFERQLKDDKQTRSDTKDSEDSNSLKDFSEYDRESELESSGSYNDRHNSEFSLFGKSKDLKPKLLDVSTLKGKRRFDRSLRGLHELCSWGAREGLRKLRSIREYLTRDYSNVFMEDLDESVKIPYASLLSFGYDTIGANFLTCFNPAEAMFCKKKTCLSNQGNFQTSMGSVDSFKSFPSSYHSFLDDDTLYSANSSMADVPAHFSAYERQSSITDSYATRESSEDDYIFQQDTDLETSHEYSTSVIHASFDNTITVEDVKTPVNRTATWSESDYDIIDKEKDLTCSVGGCGCNNSSSNSPVQPANCGEKKKENRQKRTNETASVSQKQTPENILKEGAIENVELCHEKNVELNEISALESTLTETLNEKQQIKIIQNMGSVHRPRPNQLSSKFKFKIEKDTETQQLEGAKHVHSSDSKPNQEQNSTTENSNHEPPNKSAADICKEDVTECDNYKPSDNEKNCEEIDNVESKFLDEPSSNFENNKMTESTSTLCDNDASSVISKQSDQDENNCDTCNYNIPELDNKLDTETNDNESATLPGYRAGPVQHPADGANNDDKSAIQTNLSPNEYKSDISSSLDSTVKKGNDFERRKELKRDAVEDIGSSLQDNHIDINKTDEISRTSLSEEEVAMDANGLFIETESVQSETDSLDSERPRLNSGPEKWKPRLENMMDIGGHSTSFARRKEILYLPFHNKFEADNACVHCLHKVLHDYNNLQHILYSVLSGRPVVIVGTRRIEGLVREMLYALTVFLPIVPSQNATSVMCQMKQVHISDIHNVQLRGVIRSENRPVEKVVPLSVRRYITLVDLDKLVVHGHPYQGTLLNFINAIYIKKRGFKSERALYNYIQMCLMEISTKAFNFYHCITESDADTDFCGVSVPRKSAMLELSSEKYLNKNGLLNSDCKIIKNLAELVKIQQIEEEFKNKYLTDSPVYPFSVTYLPTQTYKL